MSSHDPKADLHRYLQAAREAVVWKTEGLSEYDVRRPLTPTGTNLLGLVKHLAGVEFAYFGPVFGRPHGESLPWHDDDGTEPNADMWATADEPRDGILDLYRRSWAHADATVEALPLDATGRVPWWGERGDGVTLQRILLHMTAETNRHAGHADIVRELIDGSAGLRRTEGNMEGGDEKWYGEYRDRLERHARQAHDRTGAAGS
ncbi:DinB family protein [Streptomyces sp. NPDC012421]|uniref:DinB family protein n=1 Tax=unclassified Streptomyces TaxID=2593676 RepID=UPI003681F576